MSYWVPSIEDYDKAILEKLANIKVDLKGDGNLVPIHVTYFTPEYHGEEDRNKLRPAVVVFMYDQAHDIKREQSILSQYVSDTPTDITLKEVPTPIKFFYQFIILTDYQQHMNEIVTQLTKLFPTRGFLTVTAPNGEKVDYDFFLKGVDNGYSQQFLQYGANEQERVFRKLYRYHLMAEVDEYQEYTYKKVKSVGADAKEI